MQVQWQDDDVIYYMIGFGPGQPEVGSAGRVEYSQYVKVPLKSNYSWSEKAGKINPPKNEEAPKNVTFQSKVCEENCEQFCNCLQTVKKKVSKSTGEFIRSAATTTRRGQREPTDFEDQDRRGLATTPFLSKSNPQFARMLLLDLDSGCPSTHFHHMMLEQKSHLR